MHVAKAGAFVGLGIRIERRRRRLGLLPVSRFYLHETGEAAIDTPPIEYDGFLAAPTLRDEVTARAAAEDRLDAQSLCTRITGTAADDWGFRQRAVRRVSSPPDPRRLPASGIQLVRCDAGPAAVGYLDNLMHNSGVYS